MLNFRCRKGIIFHLLTLLRLFLFNCCYMIINKFFWEKKTCKLLSRIIFFWNFVLFERRKRIMTQSSPAPSRNNSWSFVNFSAIDSIIRFKTELFFFGFYSFWLFRSYSKFFGHMFSFLFDLLDSVYRPSSNIFCRPKSIFFPIWALISV